MKIEYDVAALVEPNECFDPAAWCETDLLDILTAALDQGTGVDPEDRVLLLNALQVYFCNGASTALANATGFVTGQGELSINRSGNNGAVKNIALNVGLDVASLALAVVQVDQGSASEAIAQAYAYRRSGSYGNYCSTRYGNSIRYYLCAHASGSASSMSIAQAAATGEASAIAGSGSSTETSVEVDGANIQEFQATVTTSASAFAATNAEAAVATFATAYASALVDVSTNAKIDEYRYNSCLYRRLIPYCYRYCYYYGCYCRYYYRYQCVGGYEWRTISHASFRSYADQARFQVERSFADAYASAMASLHVKVTIPAYFKNEPGTQDTYIFPTGEDEIPLEVSTQCMASTA